VSRFKRLIRWLLFGRHHEPRALDSQDKIRKSEKSNAFTTSRIDPIGSFLCDHIFGISNRTSSTSFKGEAGQGIGVNDDAGDFAWCRSDYLDADINSDEISGTLSGCEYYRRRFISEDRIYGGSYHGVNPANGLPMQDDCFDIYGNPFGADSNDCLLSSWDYTGNLDEDSGYDFFTSSDFCESSLMGCFDHSDY